MKNKGQALVEFILIIPIILFLVIGTIEMGNLVLQKYRLENDLDIISNFYSANKLEKIDTYTKEKNILVNYEIENNYITIKVSKKIQISTPILSNVLNNPYKLETEKVLIYEQ